MVAGENFGVLDDDDPMSHHLDSQSHIADQLEKAGLTWKAYAESMGSACSLSSQGDFACKHVPFLYFDDINGWDGSKFNPSPRCTDHVVDYSELEADLQPGKTPKYVFITPNLKSDMHDTDVATGDAWLAREVPKILESDAFNKGGVLFLLWDEGGGLLPGDDPPFIAISAHAKPDFVSQVDYDTSSYLKTVQAILGIEPLPCSQQAESVPTMDDLFSVPLTTTSSAAGASTNPPSLAPSGAASMSPDASTPTSASPTSATAPGAL
jgi:acid phosphatase